MASRDFFIRRLRFQSGERFCVLVDRHTGLPLYYPTLFITTQLRNRSLSVSSMIHALSAINVLMRYEHDHQVDIEDRIARKRFLIAHELDALRDHCQLKFRGGKRASATKLAGVASKSLIYERLTVLAQYVEWLSMTLLSASFDRDARQSVEQMVAGIRARRPRVRHEPSDRIDRALTREEVEAAFMAFDPESEVNPFTEPLSRRRNWLIFQLLYYLGIRGGELLNIRIPDIDFRSSHLVVVRRPDDDDDPRLDQPQVKTKARRLPLSRHLTRQLHDYVTRDRRRTKGARQHAYLFVTHKGGPTRGKPLSNSGYQRLIRVARNCSGVPSSFSGHMLRHTWNYRFSVAMDALDEPISASDQEKLRSYLMGWREGSGTSAIYNQRFIREQAEAASLSLQSISDRLMAL